MAGMGGNYYSALGMSIAENTGSKELESASKGLDSALNAQVANQAILTNANNSLYSIFDNTNNLVKDIQQDKVAEQQAEEDKKSKEIMTNDAINKANEATMNIVNGYESYLKEEATQALKDEITQSITGNKDINVTSNAIDKVIDNLNIENVMFKDPVTKQNIPIGKDSLKGFDKEAIRRYILNPDRLFAEYKNGFITQQQYGAISFLANNGGVANAIRKEDEAKRTLKDVNDGIKTPAMYQREAQILKETNPFFFRDKSENDIAMALSQSQNILTGRFDGKSYKPYEEFDKLRRLAKYDISNIGQVTVKNDDKSYDTTKENATRQFNQFYSNAQRKGTQNGESKTSDKALDTNNNFKIDINTGEVLPEYKQDYVKQQQEINTEANRTKNIAINMKDNETQLTQEEKEAKEKFDKGEIGRDEYESIVYSKDKGRQDTLNALASSSITDQMYKNVMNSKIMKDIQEYVSFNNKGHKDIFMTDDGEISPKYQDLLDSINIDDLKHIGKQLIATKEILEQEIREETNKDKKVAYQNRLDEVDNQLKLVNSIGKTKSKMNTFNQDYDLTNVTTNDTKRQSEHLKNEYNEAENQEREWANNKEKVSSDELDKNNNKKQAALKGNQRINNMAFGGVVGVPANAVKQDGTIDEAYNSAIDVAKIAYKFATGNDIVNFDGTKEKIDISDKTRGANAVNMTFAMALSPESYALYQKAIKNAPKDSKIGKAHNKILNIGHKIETILGTSEGVDNANVVSEDLKGLMTELQKEMVIIISSLNKNEDGLNIHLTTKNGHTLSSEVKTSDGYKDMRDMLEFFTRLGTKEVNGKIKLDNSKSKMTPIEFNEYVSNYTKARKRSNSGIGQFLSAVRAG